MVFCVLPSALNVYKAAGIQPDKVQQCNNCLLEIIYKQYFKQRFLEVTLSKGGIYTEATGRKILI